jgi:hypothetical protein
MHIGRHSLVAVLAGALLCAAWTAADAGSSPSACRAGTKRALIGGKVKCLRVGQTCKTRYQAAYRRYGFTCVKGRLHKRPAPAPPAQAGHYHGTTSQVEVIDLDVTADGKNVTNATTGQINQGCTPPLHLAGGGLQGATARIAADGTFLIEFDFQSNVSGVPSTGHFKVTGRFTGATVAGTLTVTTSFSVNGTAYSCGSGQQTWTATRTG